MSQIGPSPAGIYWNKKNFSPVFAAKGLLSITWRTTSCTVQPVFFKQEPQPSISKDSYPQILPIPQSLTADCRPCCCFVRSTQVAPVKPRLFPALFTWTQSHRRGCGPAHTVPNYRPGVGERDLCQNDTLRAGCDRCCLFLSL